MTAHSPIHSRRISLAPMMKYTDRHFRYLLRLMSRSMLLYTEMVNANAIVFGDATRHLQFNKDEQPVSLQLGGCEPQQLAQAAKIAEQEYGYNEINLNVGCPSDRVQSGQFGACLMAKPELVAQCVDAMRQQVSIPVTVKSRIGIDEQDSYEFLKTFIDTVSQAGCDDFIIHARKAWLNGLSPKENRTVPPLNYQRVYDIKHDFPDLKISINGGIESYDQVNAHLETVDGVMLGRHLYDYPYWASEVDQRYFGAANESCVQSIEPSMSRAEVIFAYLDYAKEQVAQGVYPRHLLRHLLTMYKGCADAKVWRRQIADLMEVNDLNVDAITSYIKQMPA